MAFNLTARLRLKDQASTPLKKITEQSERLRKTTEKLNKAQDNLNRITDKTTNALGRNVSGLSKAQIQAGYWLDRMGRLRDSTGKWAKTTDTATASAGRFRSSLSGSLGTFSSVNLGLKNIVATLGTLAAAYIGAQGASKLFSSTIGGAANMEMTQISLRALFGENTKDADRFFDFLNKKAAESIFAQEDFFTAGRMLTPIFKKDMKSLEYATNLVERLAASNPQQGLEGASYALREALSGDMISLRDRFNLSKEQTNKIKEAATEAQKLKALDDVLANLGYGEKYIGQVADTGYAKFDKLKDTLNIGLAGAGKDALEALKPLLDEVSTWLEGEGGQKMFDTISKGLVKMVEAGEKAARWVIENKDIFIDIWEGAKNSLVPFAEALKAASPHLEKLLKYFAENSEAIITGALTLMVFTKAFGVLAGVVNKVGGALGKLKKFFAPIIGIFAKQGLRSGITALGTALIGLINPWVLLGAAVIAAIFLIWYKWDDFVEWFKKTKAKLQPVFDKIKEQFAKLKEKMQPIIDKALEIKDKLMPAFENIKEMFLDAKDTVIWLKDEFVAFSDKVKEVLSPLKQKVTEFFNLFKGEEGEEGGKTLLKKIGFDDKTIEDLTRAIDIMKILAKGFLDWMVINWTSSFMMISDIVGFAWTGITSAFKANLTLILAIITIAFTVISGIITTVTTIWRTTFVIVWTFIAGIIKTVWNVILGVITTVTNVITGIIKVFTSILKGDWEGAWESVKQIGIDIWNGIINTLGGFVSDIVETLKRTWETTKTNVAEGWQKIKDTFSEKIESIKNTCSETWSKMKDILTEPIEKAKDTLSGIIDTIKGWFSDLLGLADKVIGKIKGVGKSEKDLDKKSKEADGSHRFGRAHIPFDGYQAVLHKGERVLTKQENQEYTNGTSRSSTSAINVSFGDIHISGASGDVSKMADELMAIMTMRLKEAGALTT